MTEMRHKKKIHNRKGQKSLKLGLWKNYKLANLCQDDEEKKGIRN